MDRQPADSTSPCIMVIFGASGDLTRRKLMPSLYRLEQDDLLPNPFTVIGYGRTSLSDDVFRERMREGIGCQAEDAVWNTFAERLHYHAGGYDDPQAHEALRGRIKDLAGSTGCLRLVFYMALPPSVTEKVLGRMREDWGVLLESARVMMEKPFGLDLESARETNALLASAFREEQVYRIDHYLAKDTVRNLMVFRFGNVMVEPLWNRNTIDSVQLTASEAIDVEGRGGYYDESGVVRDMLQNHVLAVLAMIGMEPPLAHDEESIRDRMTDVYKSIRVPSKNDFLFGQYNGYRDEEGVQPDSLTPTFVATRLFIDNWRWQGVPFYVRAGKALAEKRTEVVITFRQVPLCILGSEEACANIQPNRFVIRIQPDEGIRIAFNVQKPGRHDAVETTDLGFRYADLGEVTAESYERVILDALAGRPALFWRADGVEAAWRVVAPMLAPRDCLPYAPGGWGPKESNDLIRSDGRSWT